MASNRILVTATQRGRLTAWKVACSVCDITVWPCRKKTTAISLANQHSADFHKGEMSVQYPA